MKVTVQEVLREVLKIVYEDEIVKEVSGRIESTFRIPTLDLHRVTLSVEQN